VDRGRLTAGTNQYGLLKSTTGPTPASGQPVTTQYVYDLMGRTVGTKTTGDTGWSCVTFDARGRVVSSTTVGQTGSTSRTTSTTYTPSATGMTVAVSDGAVSGSPNGSTTTTVTDLLGRTTSYTDVWGTVTTYAYESLTGRLLSTSTTPAGGTASTTEFTYDLDGKVTSQKVDGQVLTCSPSGNSSPACS